jgi:hypothetical protein
VRPSLSKFRGMESGWQESNGIRQNEYSELKQEAVNHMFD